MFNTDNFCHELLLTTRQITKLRNAIENNMSTDIKLPKAQISKIIQSGGFPGKLYGPLLKTGLPLLKSDIHKTPWFVRPYSNKLSNRCWYTKNIYVVVLEQKI